MDPSPEQFLGLPVIGPRGDRIGTVVDVGLYNWRQPKFLLVAPEPDGALLRVDLGMVRDVDTAVRLAAGPVMPEPAAQPAAPLR